MSFNKQFSAATKADAVAILDQDSSVPAVVRQIIDMGLEAVADDQPVAVKAVGHIFNNDYRVTTADISVTPITYQKPAA